MRRLTAVFLFLLTLTSFASAANEVEMLYFTSEQCRYCDEMKPLVEFLKQKGYPIATIDGNIDQATSLRYGITSFPTFVLLNRGREVTRRAGLVPAKELASLMNDAHHKNVAEDRIAEEIARNNVPKLKSVEATTPSSTLQETRVRTPSEENLTRAQIRARRASVRLRIEDEEGTNHGSGTIIHAHENEALVITCGHIFRESKGTGKIFADIGFPDREETVTGELLQFDDDARDIALISIQLTQPIEPVPVALKTYVPQINDRVYSFGCSRGADPSIMKCKILRKTALKGVRKYDVSNRPIDGRSGGGLFTSDGRLIGICNAAVLDDDEGIYVGLESIHWQIAELNLQKLFDGAAPQIASAGPKNGIPKVTSDLVDSMPNNRAPSAGGVGVKPASSTEIIPIQDGNRTNEKYDLEIILRSRRNPNKTKTLIIDDAKPDLIRILQQENDRTKTERLNSANLQNQGTKKR